MSTLHADAADALVRWGQLNGRTLPWREVVDPYALAVAEILLQKTKSSDVIPVWRKVLAALPDPIAMSEADRADLLGLVAHLGLGNQRVGRLHAMARSLPDWRPGGRICGVGSYGSTIISLRSGLDPGAAPVDGNIARIVCRV